jgi:hypothetical protein
MLSSIRTHWSLLRYYLGGSGLSMSAMLYYQLFGHSEIN